MPWKNKEFIKEADKIRSKLKKDTNLSEEDISNMLEKFINSDKVNKDSSVESINDIRAGSEYMKELEEIQKKYYDKFDNKNIFLSAIIAGCAFSSYAIYDVNKNIVLDSADDFQKHVINHLTDVLESVFKIDDV